jgi:hypothetical protein
MNNTNRNSAAERFASSNRRRFLRGLGASLALPAFASLLPAGARAAEAVASTLAGGAEAKAAPTRMAFVYFPNGAIPKAWAPDGEGTDFSFGPTMQPLAGLKHEIQVVSGLDHINATAGPDGAGDHARANAVFLTGVRVKKTAGADIHAGVSIDQVVANRIGHLTRFPSLELTCDSVRRSGNCDSGYSCAYQHNLAWRSPSTPLPPEPNPRLVFERLFGGGSPGERRENYLRRQRQQRSILDFVMDDARSLERELGAKDQQKLEEYLASVRDIELRIQKADKFGPTPDPNVETPAGVPPAFADQMEVMFDLLVLAFQTDSTRVATLLLAGDGNNRSYAEIGIPEGHHFLSHHQGNKEMIRKVTQIDRFYMEQFAKFLAKMESTIDVDGRSLLHNSMIVYGCGNSDGMQHTHVNLPVVLAGSGGGALTGGRHLKFNSQPMCNLLLTMADRMGATGLERFGDSTGRLAAI